MGVIAAAGPDAGALAFAELLLRSRRAAGLSQRDLARAAGLSERAVRDLERGATARPRRSSVLAVAQALGLTGDELAAFAGAARDGGPAAPATLPAAAHGDLVGRGDVLRTLLGLVAGGTYRLVTVTGPSGVGKSRLAAELVGVLRGRLHRDVRTLDLSAVREPELVAELVAEALGCGGASRLAPVARVAASLRGRRVVLVLDCFERVLPAAPVVAALVERCPGLAVLVTSQRPLRLGYERVLPLPPLDAGAAAELFRRRAAQAVPGFAGDPAAVAAVCRALGGLPLAVELAAARMRLMTPAELAARLDRRLGVVAGGGPERPARHRSLRAAIEAGLDAVGDPARELFGWLGAFRGGVLLADLEAVAGVLGRDQDRVWQALDDLVDTSLVRASTGDGATRYALPDAVGELARARLGDDPRVHRAVAAHYLGALRDAGTGPAPGDAVNLRAAVDWAARHDPAVAAGAVDPLLAYFERTGRWAEGVAGLRRLGEAGLADAWAAAGRLALLRGDLDDGARCGERALAGCAAGDEAARARAYLLLGTVASERRDAVPARRHLRAALAAARRAGDLRLRARALNNLGVLSATVGRLRDAEREFTAALAAKRRTGAGPAEQGNTLHNLAELARDLDDPAVAAERAAEAAELFHAAGYRHPAAQSASTAALELARLGRPDAALAAAARAAALLGDPGDDRRTAVVLELRRSVVLHAAGRPAEAAALVRRGAAAALDADHRTREELAEVLVAHAALLAAGAPAEPPAYLLGAATALLRRSNRPVPRSAAAALAVAAQRCREALGPAVFARVFAEGTRAAPAVLPERAAAAFGAPPGSAGAFGAPPGSAAAFGAPVSGAGRVPGR